MSYPTDLDTFADSSGTQSLADFGHSTEHDKLGTAVAALEAKVGVNSSAEQTSHDYKLSGVTGADKALGTSSIGTDVQAYDADLGAIAGLSANGLIARTSAGNASVRTITGTGSEITVTNGDGVSGNPTLSLPATVDLGGKTSFELPNGTAPTVNANGEIAVDTSVADFSHGLLKYYSGEELGVVAMPIAEYTTPSDGYVVAYNATNDEFELVEQSSGGSTDGWLASADTWTYASATTFTISGVDRTAQLGIGTKLKLTQTSVKYFVVVGSSFASDTTVTVTGGSDYTLANAAITSPNYSYSAIPQGYPGWFNFTINPTWNSTPPSGTTTNYAKFSVEGRSCMVFAKQNNTVAGSGNTQVNITGPITANVPGGQYAIPGNGLVSTAEIDTIPTTATRTVGYGTGPDIYLFFSSIAAKSFEVCIFYPI